MDIKNSKLFFLRHLETSSNLGKIISGQQDIEILPLNNEIKGIDLIRNINLEKLHVFCSPLKRCLQTINVLQDTFNHKFSNIWVDDLFKERSFGSWEGIEKKQIKRDFNVFFLQNQKFNYKLTPPNGESYDDIMVRINEILHKIESYQHHPILICSHNHLMKIILQTIMKPNESFWNRFDFLNGKIYEANGITEKFE